VMLWEDVSEVFVSVLLLSLVGLLRARVMMFGDTSDSQCPLLTSRHLLPKRPHTYSTLTQATTAYTHRPRVFLFDRKVLGLGTFDPPLGR
jgi:hypothetical protein